MARPWPYVARLGPCSGVLRGEQVVHAHVNDAPVGVTLEELIDTERLLPGASGVIDARAFHTVRDEIGFDGPALVEPSTRRCGRSLQTDA